jgi:hypothetical protein
MAPRRPGRKARAYVVAPGDAAPDLRGRIPPDAVRRVHDIEEVAPARADVTEVAPMTRRQRLLRLAILRGDRAAQLILEGDPITETEKRMMWGDR